MSNSKDYCPICRQITNSISLFKEKKGSNSASDFQWSEYYELIKCHGCENLQYRTTYSDEQMTAHISADEEVQYSDITYYPKNLKDHKILSNAFQIPKKIRVIYLETIEAMKNNCYLLSAAGLRSIIEAICIQQKIHGKYLQIKINNLFKNKLITEQDSKRLHSIRFLGNDSVHEIDVPNEHKLKIALLIIENLINNLYLIDIIAEEHLDTIITDYEIFKHLLIRKFISVKLGDDKSIKEAMGKDFRRIESSYLVNFTQQIMDEINDNSIKMISIGLLKNSTIESTPVQHFIKNENNKHQEDWYNVLLRKN